MPEQMFMDPDPIKLLKNDCPRTSSTCRKGDHWRAVEGHGKDGSIEDRLCPTPHGSLSHARDPSQKAWKVLGYINTLSLRGHETFWVSRGSEDEKAGANERGRREVPEPLPRSREPCSSPVIPRHHAPLMIWIAPFEMDTATDTLEEVLWDSADQFRANSGLKALEYSGSILGIIFLRIAGVCFAAQRAKLEKASASSRRGSRVADPAAHNAEGFLYLAPNARLDFLLDLPEAADIGAKVSDAMLDIDTHNPQLAGVPPKTYNLFTSTLLIELLDPCRGRILDLAYGSGGMFVRSARFVTAHKQYPNADLSIHGVEKTNEAGIVCRMNLAVRGREGNIRHGGQINSYYDDPHEATARFDFVLANAPFNGNAED